MKYLFTAIRASFASFLAALVVSGCNPLGDLTGTDAEFGAINDGRPSLSVSDATTLETSDVTFTITLSKVYPADISVDYETSDYTALAGTHYNSTSGSLTFASGETTKTVTVSVIDNPVYDGNKAFQFRLSNQTEGVLGEDTAYGAIIDNEVPPTLTIDDVTVAENAGTATFTVSLHVASASTVTVDYTTSNGTAAAGSDYVATSGTLSFSPGDTSETINVTITNDTEDEADETYTITLSNETNSTISDATGTGTITDNDITVDQTDDDNTATGFGGGSHNGTTYSGSALTLNATTNNAELDESWTPQWNNLVAYWKLNESGSPTSFSDSVSSPVNGSCSGGACPTPTTGKLNNGMSFDGNDTINAGTNSKFDFGTNNFSLSAWVKPTGTSNRRVISSGWYGWTTGYMIKANTTHLSFGMGGTGGGASNSAWLSLEGTYNDGNWHHVVITVDRTNNLVSIYRNGILETPTGIGGTGCGVASGKRMDISGCATLSGDQSANLHIGSHLGNEDFTGGIDDVALWGASLSEEEVAIIYSRQSAKYAGAFESRVIDSQSASSSWTNIDWLTSLPFGKELPSNESSESSLTDYSALNTDTLMSGNVGLWRFNEASGTTGNGSILDSSGNANHGTPVNVTFGHGSRLHSAAEFTGLSTSYLTADDDTSLNFSGGSLTMSAWVKLNQGTPLSTTSHFYTIAGKGTWGQPLYMMFLRGGNTSYRGFTFRPSSGSSNYQDTRPTSDYSSVFLDYDWHHVSATYDSSTSSCYIYIDGKEVGSRLGTCSFNADNTRLMYIGNNDNKSTGFPGQIDEVAIWNKALNSDQILELYRRGANRLKLQIRSCSAADCSDQDAATGDGWKGPGGNYLSYFSELQNNSSVSATCASTGQCYESEISTSGDVQASSASMYFSSFTTDGIGNAAALPSDNRYFQYRVIMESDDQNTACSGSVTCMPELESVSIGPVHTYE